MEKTDKNTGANTKASRIMILLLSLIVIGSLLYILIPSEKSSEITASIYQDGKLLRQIPLNTVTAPYTFTVQGPDGCSNEIEVRPGEIGVIAANCPDKLCIGQGFINDSKLPIVCLPNQLVIQLSKTASSAEDAVTY